MSLQTEAAQMPRCRKDQLPTDLSQGSGTSISPAPGLQEWGSRGYGGPWVLVPPKTDVELG